MNIIDCHCHIYPDKIAAKATESIGKFYDLPMRYGGTAAEMIRESRNAGITHSVVFSVATKPSQAASINRFISEEVNAEKGRLVGLGAVHPDSENQREDIENLVSLGLKGVKLHPDIQAVALDDPRCLEIYRICREFDLTVLIHMGDLRYDYSAPDRLIRVLEEFPGLRVIGAHLGGWSVWEEAENKLNRFENLMVDCSSTLAFMEPERARDLIRGYGAERVLFGTDYPMWDFKDELKRFDALGLRSDEAERILWKNSAEIFGIK